MSCEKKELGIEAGKLTLRIARTIEEIEQLREIWSLWCEDPNADIDYFLASAQFRSDFVRPHVMVVYRDCHPDCMLIGRLEHARVNLNVGYSTLFRPHVRRLFFVQGGFLGNQSHENSELLVSEIMSCLQNGEADAAEFLRAREDSSLYRAAKERPSFFCRGHFSPIHEHRSARLPNSFDEFLQGMSRKNRHELRRHEKKLKDEFGGEVRIHCYRTEEEVKDLAEEVNKVSEKTYQRALGVGFKTDVETIESLRLAAHRGGLRGCVLYLADEPCAFFIGNQYKNKFHGNFMGFDSRFGKYSPGLYILMHSIEECFEPDHRATEIDLGWGDRQYKRTICNQSWKDGPLYLYAPSFKGIRLNCLRTTTSLIDMWARNLLLRSKLLQRLKKAWQVGLRRLHEEQSSLNAETE
ncbi:MAG: GNAT family N-acetyltransferase [Candidatus Sulfotelmatobacter sp.]